MKEPILLLVPEKTDVEVDKVLASWTKIGGLSKRLGKFWIVDEELRNFNLSVYGNQAFALVIAQIYNLELLSPDDTLISRLPRIWTKRAIRLSEVKQLTDADFPNFIKPVVPKMFLAGVYNSFSDFQLVTIGISPKEQILISSIINPIDAEARCYVKNKEIKDIALYEGSADLESGKDFIEKFLLAEQSNIPASVVIDIGYSKETGWFILEFNACWGAGLNNCNPENVIDCIISSTLNK